MMNIRFFLASGFFCLLPVILLAQDSLAVDTTSRGYQIGYSIGQYIPVAVILILALLVIRRSYRLSQEKK